MQEENNLTAAGYSDGTHTEIFQSQRRQVTVKTVGYTGWKLVGVVPAETLRDNYSQLLLFALFIVSFSIFLLVFVNLRLSEWITAPMKKLRAQEAKFQGSVRFFSLQAVEAHGARACSLENQKKGDFL